MQDSENKNKEFSLLGYFLFKLYPPYAAEIDKVHSILCRKSIQAVKSCIALMFVLSLI
jgi:hypothetical protein